MGDAIGCGQGGAHLPGPTCASRFKTRHHTARWGIFIAGEDLALAGLSILPISIQLNYTSRVHLVVAVNRKIKDLFPMSLSESVLYE